MNKQEVDMFFKKLNGKKVEYLCDKGECSLLELFLSGQYVPFDRPDAYLVSNNEVLIIEHFSFNSYITKKKGGNLYRKEFNEIEKSLNEKCENDPFNYVEKKINVKSSYVDYIDNCKRIFEDHYNKIDEYRKHLIANGIATEEQNFKVCFLLDEDSILGSAVMDNNRPTPIFLYKSKEFLDFYKKHPKVDWVFSVGRIGNVVCPYFFTHKSISLLENKVIDYASKQFLSFTPTCLGASVVKNTSKK